jgi:hypothetical protein
MSKSVLFILIIQLSQVNLLAKVGWIFFSESVFQKKFRWGYAHTQMIKLLIVPNTTTMKRRPL